MTSPSPFLKWVGGKGRLLEQLGPLLPARVGTWVEPFLGGGSVLLSLGLSRAEKLVAADVNFGLINAFRAVRDDVERLIEELDGLQVEPFEQSYYRLRGEYNYVMKLANPHSIHADVRLAALFIWLNKTGFNGLYRTNQQGELNVACGAYTEPVIYVAEELRATSAALRYVALACVPWQRVLDTVVCNPFIRSEDFVYLDPPYTPASASGSEVRYDAGGFDHTEHVALRDACLLLSQRGVRFALSQADTPLTRELYHQPGWDVQTVTVRRSISRSSDTRGAVTELVVRNYT